MLCDVLYVCTGSVNTLFQIVETVLQALLADMPMSF